MILKILKEKGGLDFSQLKEESKLEQDKLMWSVENLKASKLVKLEGHLEEQILLSDEGRGALSEFPEEALLDKIGEAHLDISKANSIGLMWAKRNGWIDIKNGKISLTAKGFDAVKSHKNYILRRVLERIEKNDMDNINDNEKSALEVLIKRKMLIISKGKSNPIVSLTPLGENAAVEDENGIGALTHEVIANAKWKEFGFRRYMIDAPTEQMYASRLHPMREFMNKIRETWFSMGFTEVSGPIIESSFWNFDALFSPQDHPTRDMQDTFFLNNPENIEINDREAVLAVSEMHRKNWRSPVSASMQKQAVLRTHTTSISARHIRQFAKSANANKVVKLFSIGRAFRNENIDFKHLAEIIQTEGIIIGENLNFSNLFDALIGFYEHMGIHGIRFRPSYFPFTEPSLEMYRIRDDGTSIELGGAGMIREEIAHSLGTNKNILAWGLGADRLLMQKLGAKSLSEIYTNDMKWLRRRAQII